MAERPAYAILGSGYWAGRMRTILAEAHRVTCIEGARRRTDESPSGYQSRLSESLKATGAQISWICVPPGPHIPLMAEAALNAGLHVIAEKPWLNSRAETKPLLDLASRRELIFGVHYQYCLLEAVEAWGRDLNAGAGLEFNGRFRTSRADRLGMDALDNLGSHLMAIWNYAVPHARVATITCGYESVDERKVWLEKAAKCVASIDFLENREPIVQRFIERVEGVITGEPFPFGIEFALRVAESTHDLRLKPTG
jgi:predicted dehydrogenase